MESLDGLRNGNRTYALFDALSQRLEDGVTSEPLITAVTLNCGHSYNESTIQSLAKQDRSKYLCPECRTPIHSYQPSYVLRNLSESISRLPLPSEPKESSPKKEEQPKSPVPSANPVPSAPPQEDQPDEIQVEKAQAHFQRGKTLFEQGFQEEAVEAILKAIELDRNFEKAIVYLDFITDPKRTQRPSLGPIRPPVDNDTNKHISQKGFQNIELDKAPPQISESRRSDNAQGKSYPESKEEKFASQESLLEECFGNFAPCEKFIRKGYKPTSSEFKSEIKASFAISYGGYKIERDTTEDLKAYLPVREYFLLREVELGHIDNAHLNVIKDFQFPHDSLVATYTNPRTGTKFRIPMRDVAVKDKEADIVLRPYFPKSKKWQTEMRISLHAYSKGNNFGEVPLQKKKDSALEKLSITQQDVFDKLLPKALVSLVPNLQADPRNKEIIVRRFLFVDFFQKRVTQSFRDMITDRERELQGSIDPMTALRKQSEIKELRTFLTKLSRLDIYALYTALAAYPIGHDDLEQIRTRLQTQIKADILAHTGFIFSNKELNKEQTDYCLDVLGLLSPDVRDYGDFCRKNERKMKKESIEDIFMREAIKFGAQTIDNEFLAENFENCIFLNEMGEMLRQEVKAKFLVLGAIATHAIGPRQNDEYLIPPPIYLPNATNSEKKVADASKAKSDFELLKRHIAAHRGRVAF